MNESNTNLSFWEWVDIIGKHNFNPRNNNLPVRLSFPREYEPLKEEFIRKLRNWNQAVSSVSYFGTCKALIQAWKPNSGLIEHHQHLASGPPNSTCDFPPYLPYLIAFSMAWNVKIHGCSVTNYYKRLNVLFPVMRQESRQAYQTKFRELAKPPLLIWAKLSNWANQIKQGEIGSFSTMPLGAHQYVGYPLSQVLLNRIERNVLKDIFASNRLLPEHSIEDSEIKFLLLRNSHEFNARIQNALENDASEILATLYELFRQELAYYEPPIPATSSGGSIASSIVNLNLRMTCSVGMSEISRWGFIVEPEDIGMFVQMNSGSYVLNPGQEDGVITQCKDDAIEPLTDPLKFSSFDPLKDELKFSNPSHVVTLKKREIRIFAKTIDLWVEQEWIPDKTPFLVLSKSENEKIVGCDPAKKLPGLNCWLGFDLYSFQSPESKRKLEEEFPSRARRYQKIKPIEFEDGVRYEPGKDVYFEYGLPNVRLQPGWELKSQDPSLSLESCEEHFEIKIAPNYCPRKQGTKFILKATKDDDHRVPEKPIFIVRNPDPLDTVDMDWLEATPLDGEFPCWNDNFSNKNSIPRTSASMRLWETLSSWGTRGCAWYPNFKRLSFKLFPDVKQSWVVNDWSRLGLIEIINNQEEGVWKRISIAPGRLQRLPWNITLGGETYLQAVLLGQVNWQMAQEVIADLPDNTCEILDSSRDWVPPRFRFLVKTDAELRKIAENLHVKYVEFINVDINGGINSYLEQLNSDSKSQWREHTLSPSNNIEYFSPFLLQDQNRTEGDLERLEAISAQYILETYNDPDKIRPPRYCLYDSQRESHKLLRQNDRQIARWVTYNSNVKRFSSSIRQELPSIGLPYDRSSGTFFIPTALEPPSSLHRLLISCTGSLPKLAGDDLMSKICTLGPDFEENFNSSFVYPKNSRLIQYQKIPSHIASYVCKLLGTVLVDTDL